MIVLKEESSEPSLPSGTYNSELYVNGDKLYYSEENGNRVCISDPISSAPSPYTKVSKTSNYTIQSADVQSSTIFDNNGSTGTITFTLPTGTIGKDVLFFVSANYTVNVTGGTLVGKNGTSYTTATASTIGSICKAVCIDSNKWYIDTYSFTLS